LFLRKDAGKELEYRGLISNEGSGAAMGNTSIELDGDFSIAFRTICKELRRGHTMRRTIFLILALAGVATVRPPPVWRHLMSGASLERILADTRNWYRLTIVSQTLSTAPFPLAEKRSLSFGPDKGKEFYYRAVSLEVPRDGSEGILAAGHYKERIEIKLPRPEAERKIRAILSSIRQPVADGACEHSAFDPDPPYPRNDADALQIVFGRPPEMHEVPNWPWREQDVCTLDLRKTQTGIKDVKTVFYREVVDFAEKAVSLFAPAGGHFKLDASGYKYREILLTEEQVKRIDSEIAAGKKPV